MMKKKGQADVILIKYGGNAMKDDAVTRELLKKVYELSQKGYHVVIVHGGGPFIEDTLKLAGIETEFVEGHRKTTGEAIKYIEMALKGHVNSKLVKMLNQLGMKAVGLSGKDGKMVEVVKRYHTDQEGKQVDIGYVGDIKTIDTTLLGILLSNDFVPVVSTISSGEEDGEDYNVNADMFAGFLAGILEVKHFIMLTDVDGLMKDPSEPSSLIREIKISEMENLYQDVIKGGMIPKTEACKAAIEFGAEAALIINGKKPERLLESLKETKDIQGTRFVK